MMAENAVPEEILDECEAPEPRPELPFVGAPSDGRSNYWAPTLTGDTQKDYLLGLQYADDALDFARRPGQEYFFAFVLMDMLRSFGFAHDEKSMEVAFLVRLARFAKFGAPSQVVYPDAEEEEPGATAMNC
ncbi:MAG: hypothetical protein WBX25_12860 [Rhodomicrobium sp.]